MKEIISHNYRKRFADLVTHPPVANEDDNRTPKKKKKKKKLPQLGRFVEDVTLNDIR